MAKSGHGPLTKMVAMPIYMEKKHFKNPSSPEPRMPLG